MLLASLIALASFQSADVPPTVLTITVQKLPPKFQQNPVIRLTFNDKGAVAGCETVTTSGSAGIDRVACTQAVSGYTVEPENGKAPAPANVIVAFEAEASKN